MKFHYIVTKVAEIKYCDFCLRSNAVKAAKESDHLHVASKALLQHNEPERLMFYFLPSDKDYELKNTKWFSLIT